MLVMTRRTDADGSCSRPSPRLCGTGAPGQNASVCIAAALNERGSFRARPPSTHCQTCRVCQERPEVHRALLIASPHSPSETLDVARM